MSTILFYVCIIILAVLNYGISESFFKRKTRQYYANQKCEVVLIKKQFHQQDFISVIFEIISYFILLVPLANRNCGADTKQYYRIYQFGERDLEPLFIGFIDLLKRFIDNPKIGIGVIGAVSLLLVFYAFRILRDHYSATLCLLAYCTCLYFYLYNYVRMMFAASIIILAYALILKGNKTASLICMVIAIGFHKSAVVVLAVYLMYFLFQKHKAYLIIGSIACIITFLMFPVSFINMINDERFSAQVNQHQLISATIGFGTILRALPMMILIVLVYKKYKDDKDYFGFLFAQILNLGFSLTGYFVPSTSRLSNMYFVYHILFFIPWLYRKERKNSNKYIYTVLYVLYCFFNFYLLSGNFKLMKIDPYF